MYSILYIIIISQNKRVLLGRIGDEICLLVRSPKTQSRLGGGVLSKEEGEEGESELSLRYVCSELC